MERLPNENPPVAGAAAGAGLGLPNSPPVEVDAVLLDPNSPPPAPAAPAPNPVCAGCCVVLEPKSPPPVAGVAEVMAAGLAPKLKPPVVAEADCAGVVVGFEVVLPAPPPKEKPPEEPEKGLLAGGWEKEKDADRPRVEPVDAAGVEPNIANETAVLRVVVPVS